MRKLSLALGLSMAALLGACGGGGGSPGDTQLVYTITLRADRTALPTNIAGQPAGIGAYAPYTTTLHVEAREGGKPIPGLKDAFACNLAAGLETGALYYLDGDDEHEDEDGNALAFRNITLDSNSGGNSFHFHSGTKSGTARITCSITNPRDNQVSSASVDIVVGGATGMPASVIGRAQAPGFLGSQGNINNVRNNVAIQAFIMDDANQPIPNPSGANVRVRILGGDAAGGARLTLAGQSGAEVLGTSNGGVALFALTSGPSTGVIVLELAADRADNNVANGIQDSVAQLMAISVIDGSTAAAPVGFTPVQLSMEQGTPFFAALLAEGGTPPYTWRALGAVPVGLTFSSDGVISGAPTVVPGVHGFRVRVTDANGTFAEGAVTITVTAPPPPPTPPASSP